MMRSECGFGTAVHAQSHECGWGKQGRAEQLGTIGQAWTVAIERRVDTIGGVPVIVTRVERKL